MALLMIMTVMPTLKQILPSKIVSTVMRRKITIVAQDRMIQGSMVLTCMHAVTDLQSVIKTTDYKEPFTNYMQ